MRWIKASERVPDHYRSVHVRYTRDGVKCSWTVRFNPSLGNWVSQGAESLIEATDLEWLDESIPASIEDEAERLYPYPERALADERHYIDKQRSAHITCARQYMGEIERMGKLCMEKDGQIEALQNEIEKLRAELTKIEGIARRFGNGSDPEKDIELIETLATEALK